MGARLRKAFFRAILGMVRGPYVTAVGTATIFVAVFATGFFATALSGAEQLLQGWAGEVRISVYLAPRADLEAAREAASTIALGRKVVAVPAAVALKRLSESLGEKASLLGGVEEGALPDSVEVSAPDLDLAGARALASRLREIPGAADVDYGNEWLTRLESLVKRVRRGGLLLLVAVALATSVLVSNTLRLAVFARRDEIEIMKLVGATDGFIAAPFLLEGMIEGLLGSGVAVSLLYALTGALLQKLKEAVPAAAGLTPEGLMPTGLWVPLILGGMGVGLIASALSVARALGRP